MKSLLLASIALLLAPGIAFATLLSVGTIEQPLNLGPEADPQRIPLAPVVVESNHGYDVHGVISDPRPCTHGALAWQNGLELNMNLASAFGIEVLPEDPTEVPRRPVTINIKDWPVPAYSPYRRDQVLAATLHCLLRSVHAPPQTPLRILIRADNARTARDLSGFAGSYLTAEAEDRGGPTPVPGTRLETDPLGITYVVFPDLKPNPHRLAQRPPPTLIPFHIPDDTDDLAYDLIPVWAGDTWKEHPRDLLFQSITLFYDRYDQSRSTGPDINALTRLGVLTKSEWKDTLAGTELSIHLRGPSGAVPADLAPTLSAFCHALVLSTQPSGKRPLTLRIHVNPPLLAAMNPFVGSPDWQVKPGGKDRERIFSCTFAWNAEERALSRGSLPIGELTSRFDRPWSITFEPRERDAPAPVVDDLPARDPQR